MAAFDVYVFAVCAIVFVLLTAALGYGVVHITKLTVKLIKTGAEDKKSKLNTTNTLKTVRETAPYLVWIGQFPFAFL